MSVSAAYAPPRHPAPCDLDLSGAESFASGRSERYPDARPLEAQIAALIGVDANRLLITAGADEALDRCCRATLGAGRHAVITDPTFEMIPRYIAMNRGTATSIPWPLGDFPTDLVIAAATEDTSLVVIVTPNNPTGLVAPVESIRRLHDAVPKALIVVDLAYAEFADCDPMAELLALERVICVRTLSKAWGMPGARVGYAVGSAETIALLRGAGGPFPVSASSLTAAAELISSGGPRMRETVRLLRQNRGTLESKLNELGACTLPSQGNFVCVAGARAPWLRDALAGLGIASRFFPGEDRDRLRITVPVEVAAFSRLMAAIESALAPEAVLFDLDGVIADVSRSYREAIRLTAASFGVTVTPAQIAARKAAGNANDDWTVTSDLIRAGGVACDLDAVTAEFERVYQGRDETPGLRELESSLVPAEWLRELSTRIPLAIVTGRPRADAERFLRRFGFLSRFAAVIAREDAELKPSPAPVLEALRRLGVRRAWMLGDTPDDIMSARAAGILPIGVLTDNDDTQRIALTHCGAARVIRNSTEIDAGLP
jgi:HAD superfamily hydrolase (TIGR01548 family)